MMTIEISVENLAHIAHEMNRHYCEYLGDYSQPCWHDAPEWQRESAINGVKACIANPSINPEDSHNSWAEEKRQNGWKYGSVKDPEQKTHPCLVPFGELPIEQQIKDVIFTAVVKTLLAFGTQIPEEKRND